VTDTESQAGSEAAEAQTEDMSLLDQIMQETRMQPSDEGYDVARQGIEAFIAELVKPNRAGEKIQAGVVDQMIVEIDKNLSNQLDAVMHNEEFQKLESSWRGLKFLVDRTDFRQNTKVELLNISKDELREDFEDAPEIVKSGLYKHVYTDEYGQFGGQPVGCMIANYDFDAGPQDIQLLRDVSSVGAMAHAPFIAAAAPKMFGVDKFEEVAGLKDLQSIFEGPQYAKWNSFRESEDSRYVGLTAPRFMLRGPYNQESNPVKAFNYSEQSDGETDAYLWGNTAFAFASRLSDSFAKYRWTPNIIGPQGGGAVEDMTMHQYESMGQIETKAPTEVMISDRREYEMAEQGFIALTLRKGSDNAAFFSANSVQKPKYFGNTTEGKEAETNYKLGTQLPYMFVINRLAHYVKVLQRENIGSWKDKGELQGELNNWIRQYVSDQENPSAEVRSRRPLRKAEISVEDVEGEPGWYRVNMAVQPHFKYMGADFTLSLKGKLDKS
jgi:type VI secretion system protein ImpC